MYNWIQKNKIATGVIIVLLALLGFAILYCQFNNRQYLQDIQEENLTLDEKKDEGKILKNDDIENIYNKMINRLPSHFMVCIPTEMIVCTEGECEKAEPKVFNLLSGGKNDSNISRCDSKGCDTYLSIHETTGIFEIVQPKEPRGFFLKRQAFSLDEEQVNNYLPYTEIVSLFLTTQISSGYCIDVKYSQ